jgi:PKD repeat protein
VLASVFGSLLAVTLLLGCSDAPNSLIGPQTLQTRADASQGALTGQERGLGAAISAQRRHTPGLLRIEGVVGTAVGLDEDGNAAVKVLTARPGVGGIPAWLDDDVPVRVVVTGMFVAGNTTSRERPAPVGYSVGHKDITAGTIGARVINASGNTFILSNNHVLANSNDGSIGDPILQPGPFDGGSDPGDRIGTLADYEAIDFTLSGQNYMDAAIAAVSAADVDVSTPPDGYGTPNAQPYDLDENDDGNVDASVIGLSVKKYGRTTQLTAGEITDINATVEVCYEVLLWFCLKSAYMYDQIIYTNLSQGGDSGSLIVTDDANNSPVSLLFAGSDTHTIGNRIDRVLQRFGVSVDDGSGGGDPGGGDPPGGNEPPVASFTYSCPDLSCDFDGSGSSDSDGSLVSYDWAFGDGSTASGSTASHTYGAAGTYSVTLTVTDDGDLTDDDQQSVTVSDPPSGEPTLVGSKRKVKGKHVIDLTWSNVPWPVIYVFRDGVPIETIDPGSESGSYSDFTGQKGKRVIYTHFICEGLGLLDQCSNLVITTF